MNTRNKPTRVCIIRRAYYPAESHVRRNAETLTSVGFTVHVICLRDRGEPPAEVVNGVCVHRIPLRARRGSLIGYLIEYLLFAVLAFFWVSMLHARQAFWAVEADSMPDLLVFCGLVPRLMGSRVVLYLFESMPELWAQKNNKAMTHWTIRLLRLQERVSCGFAHKVICCHELARQALVQNGVPPSKVAVVLNVPDERLFSGGTRANQRGHREFRLVQHGTITENYGIQVVLHALRLAESSVLLHYHVIGRGEYLATLQTLARELGVEAKVTFQGFLPLERMPEVLGDADAGVVPMLFEYMSPNKLFELVALKKPVIASRLRTFEQHFDGDQILYFEKGNAAELAAVLARAAVNRQTLHENAARAFERYERQYRWGRMKDQYLSVYAIPT